MHQTRRKQGKTQAQKNCGEKDKQGDIDLNYFFPYMFKYNKKKIKKNLQKDFMKITEIKSKKDVT